MMFRIALAAIAGFTLTGTLAAAPINAHGSAQFNLGGGNFTTTNINTFGSATNGFSFTNNITTNTGGGPAIGSQIVTVGATTLTTYQASNGVQTVATYNGNPIVAVTAIQGTIVPGPGGTTVTAQFQSGKVGFFTISSVTAFNPFDPNSWGATTNNGQTLVTPLAVFTIKPQELIINGPGGRNQDVPQPPSNVNVSSLNSTSGVNTQGHFLFKEDLGVNSILGDSFMEMTSGLLPGFTELAEALHIRSDQGIQFADADNTSFISGGVGTAGFNALNTIATQLGGLGLFASSFGNVADPLSYVPATGVLGNGFANSADAMATLGGTFYPSVQQQLVPEPTSIALFGVVAGVGGLIYRNRRNRNVTI